VRRRHQPGGGTDEVEGEIKRTLIVPEPRTGTNTEKKKKRKKDNRNKRKGGEKATSDDDGRKKERLNGNQQGQEAP